MKIYTNLKTLVKNYLTLIKYKTGKDITKIIDYDHIGLINQAICTENIGDTIITESLIKEIKEIFKFSFIKDFPGQLKSSMDYTLSLTKQNLIFVGGTNLLNSRMNKFSQWKINPYSKLFLQNKFILFGVGWWQYEKKPNKYTAQLLKKLLSDKYLHSVRDSYTETKLKSIGIDNVINTSCPTLWGIDNEFCKKIPVNKSNNVVATLTSYKPDSITDKKILEILSLNYKNVYIWLQGSDDYKYLKSLSIDMHKFSIIDSSLNAFENVLNNDDIEYIGTRLHGGIKALQKCKRTLILAVDNRAIEINKDINLNVIKRTDFESILSYIANPYHTIINLPINNIKRWKEQFVSNEN